MTGNESKYGNIAIIGGGRGSGRTLKAHIDILQELEAYRTIGTVEELKSMKENGAFTGVELAQLAAMQMRLKEYSAIGTIEEFKALKEKSVARKIRGTRFEEAICPRCESELFDTYWAFGGIHYCSNCGQAINWQ